MPYKEFSHLVSYDKSNKEQSLVIHCVTHCLGTSNKPNLKLRWNDRPFVKVE